MSKLLKMRHLRLDDCVKTIKLNKIGDHEILALMPKCTILGSTYVLAHSKACLQCENYRNKCAFSNISQLSSDCSYLVFPQDTAFLPANLLKH